MWTVIGVVVAGVCLCAGILALGDRYEKQARPRAARWTRQAFGPAVGLTVFVGIGALRGTSAKILSLQVAVGAAGAILGTLTAVLRMQRKKKRQMDRIGQDPDQPRTN
jgi:hypothetical protein